MRDDAARGARDAGELFVRELGQRAQRERRGEREGERGGIDREQLGHGGGDGDARARIGGCGGGGGDAHEVDRDGDVAPLHDALGVLVVDEAVLRGLLEEEGEALRAVGVGGGPGVDEAGAEGALEELQRRGGRESRRRGGLRDELVGGALGEIALDAVSGEREEAAKGATLGGFGFVLELDGEEGCDVGARLREPGLGAGVARGARGFDEGETAGAGGEAGDAGGEDREQLLAGAVGEEVADEGGRREGRLFRGGRDGGRERGQKRAEDRGGEREEDLGGGGHAEPGST